MEVREQPFPSAIRGWVQDSAWGQQKKGGGLSPRRTNAHCVSAANERGILQCRLSAARLGQSCAGGLHR